MAKFWLVMVAHFPGEEHEQFSSRVCADFKDLPGNRKRRRTSNGHTDGSDAQSMSVGMTHDEMNVLFVLRRMEAVHKGNMAQAHLNARGPPWVEWKLEGGGTIADLAVAHCYHHVLARLKKLGMNPLVCPGDGVTVAESNGRRHGKALEAEHVGLATNRDEDTHRAAASAESTSPSSEPPVVDFCHEDSQHKKTLAASGVLDTANSSNM